MDQDRRLPVMVRGRRRKCSVLVEDNVFWIESVLQDIGILLVIMINVSHILVVSTDINKRVTHLAIL